MKLFKSSFIFILTVFFSGLIVRHFLITSSQIEGLENNQSNCTTKRINGCKSIAVERNAQNIIYTNTLKTTIHKKLNKIINNILNLYIKRARILTQIRKI